jgi:hypothetical protein
MLISGVRLYNHREHALKGNDIEYVIVYQLIGCSRHLLNN